MRHLIILLMTGPLFLLAQDVEIKEHLQVTYRLIEVRVQDARGNPITDLQPEDFKLSNRGRQIPVQSAIWIDETQPPPDFLADLTRAAVREDVAEPSQERALSQGVMTPTGFLNTDVAPLPAPASQPPAAGSAPDARGTPPRGRFLVVLVQNDIAANLNQALVRIIRQGKKMVDELHEDDWVAVFSFDSQLKMHLDFTRDREAAREAIGRCLTKVPGRILEGGSFPAIADHFDDDAAAQAADIESGVTLLARALNVLPGKKYLAWMGWGFGDLDPNGVKTDRRYDHMVSALHDAQVTVFSLDISMAEYHSLEVALMRVAEETGGIYERCANHPELSMKRFLSAIQGYYLISFPMGAEARVPKLNLTVRGRRKARVSFAEDYKILGKPLPLLTRP